MLLGIYELFNPIVKVFKDLSEVRASAKNTVPSKSSWTMYKFTKYRYPQNSSHPIQNDPFSANNDDGCQTIWIGDQAPRFVGPDLDPYCLKRSFKISMSLEIVRKYFHFVQELLENCNFGR